MYKYLSLYGYSLFGSEILTFNIQTYINGIWYFAIDNAYIHFLIEFGVIITVGFMYFIRKTLKCAFNDKNYIFIMILASYLIYGMSESVAFNFLYNPFLLYLCGFINFNLRKGCVNNESNINNL